MLALPILARQVTRIRAKSFSPTRPVSRAWFSPLSMRCLRPCTPPVRLFSVYSLHVQPSIRQVYLKPNLAPSVTRPSLDSAGTRRPVWSVSSTEAPESSVHLGRCPSLKKIFGTINKALGFAPRQNRSTQEQTLDTLFCFPHKSTPPSVAHLYMIAWRFIITDFYQLNYNKELPPFDEVQAYSIYKRTLERYTTLVHRPNVWPSA
eukprot:scaffold907_cov120-Isochrysis_galbana.AAC.6